MNSNERLIENQLPFQKAVAERKAAIRIESEQAQAPKELGAADIHENWRQLNKRAFYPAHDARKESAEYAKVPLCVTLNLPWLVCGVS